ncbi:MAG: tetratricopeptide repeat protein [Spirochaetes bacterium]|nr:tetratricopeptide repeat protein [Spirochaetota bacterium]
MLKKTIDQDQDSQIEYTSEELEEIERIISVLPGSSAPEKTGEIYSLSDSDRYPAAGISEEDETEDFTSGFDESESDDSDEFDDLGSVPDLSEDSFPKLPSFSDEADEDIQDITSFIEEVPSDDFSDITGETGDVSDLSDSFDTGTFDSSADEFPDIPSFDEDFPAAEDSAAEGLPSTMGQLNALTQNEPDSVDDQEISENAVIDDTISPFPDDFSLDAGTEMNEGINLETSSTDNIPDFSDLSVESLGGIDEAGDSDIPDIDISGFGDDDFGASVEPDLTLDESEGIAGVSEDLMATKEVQDDLFSDLPDIPDMDQIEDIVENTPYISDIPEPEPEPVTRPAAQKKTSGDTLDLSSDELKKVKKSLLLFPPGLTEVIKDVILNDRINSADMRRLVDMILDGRPEVNIQRFLEKKLNIKINAGGTADSGSRRTLYARPEYTTEGKERQKILIRRTRNIAMALLLTVTAGLLTYQYAIKPAWAKSLIKDGVELIRRKNDPKIPDYKKAEELFNKAQEKVPDFVYGYNEYGRAYFFKKEYESALNKFNRGYDISAGRKFSKQEDIDNLISLGYFYSRMPDRFFRSIKSSLNEYYYTENKYPALEKIETKLDVAVDFYRKALNKDPKNEDALYGIGNAYFYQGQLLKAKNYYEEIIKNDDNSVVGYSGLLNLYIEKDDFPGSVMIYVKLRDKKILPKCPSALLGKLANYFLSKSKTDLQNIRIDYGIQSARLLDSDDEPFPAVATVLSALQAKDPNYPPLYLYYAKLADKMKNYKLVEKHLLRAIDKADAEGEDYFGARLMLGDYYYRGKEPVKAMKQLKLAENAIDNPASFELDDFYVETESHGKVQAVMGNIFYYFFDKIRFEMGDQESLSEDEVKQDNDKLANFLIAQKRYENAIEQGFTSSEIYYNLGRIYYLNKEYEKSLNSWLNLYDDFTASPELMFALGNVFYKMNNSDAAKSEYLKLIDIYEYEAEKIKSVKPENPQHIKIFQTLSSVYNNIGVVYQTGNDETRSAISYWKSIEYASRLNRESEFARVNIGRSFKERKEPIVPVLDDNIPYSVPYYREAMRKF